MTKELIKKRIYELASEFYKEIKDNREENNLVQMYSANSIDSIEFLLILEDEYNIEFDDTKLNIQSMMDVDLLVDMITQSI